MRHFSSPKRADGGQAMIMATVFFVFITTAMIIAVSTMAASSQGLTKQYQNERTSFYVAESALDSAVYNRLHGLPIGDAPVIEGLQATLETGSEDGEEIITATAVSNGVEGAVEARLSTGSTTEIVSWKELR